MKLILKTLIHQALASAYRNGALPESNFPDIIIEVPKILSHGDYSTNIAMASASIQKMPPRQIAGIIVDHLADAGTWIERTNIAGPGFINFFICPKAWIGFLNSVHEQGERYGASDIGKGKKIQIEFVSSNPTGPLHVGHGRGAAVGDCVANILSFCGYTVQKEYYINDSGRQIHTLGTSVFFRYRELTGESIHFPADCYQGDYIKDIARQIFELKNTKLLERSDETAIMFCARYAANLILEGMKEDLESFGVQFDCWYSEQSLYDSGKVGFILDLYRQRNIIYEKDGALWFNTTAYGDEKDRVVVRQNGQTTYFASDIAYHYDKIERGFVTKN